MLKYKVVLNIRDSLYYLITVLQNTQKSNQLHENVTVSSFVSEITQVHL